MSELSEELERLAVEDWPAAQSERLDVWQLRYTDGVTMRGNSVAAGAQLPDRDLELALDEVERRYAARGLPACFQLFDHAPPALDAALAACGYEVAGGSWVQTATSAVVDAVPVADGRLRVHVRATCDAEWLGIAAGRSRFAPDAGAFAGFVERIGSRAGHAIAYLDGAPVAAALGVISRRWLGIYAMVTVDEARRRGAARTLVDALRAWARERGVSNAYLLVGKDNAGAIELYRRAGFATVASYHYRRRRAPAPPPA